MSESQKKRLVLVAHDIGGVGGMERHLEEMIYRLRDDYSLTVVSATLRIADRTSIRHIRVPVLHRPFPIMALMFAFYASLWIKLRSKDAIVHTTGAIVLCKSDISTVHFCHAGWYRGVAERGRNRRGSPFHRLNQSVSIRMKLWMERFCYRPLRTSALVAVSRRVGKELAEIYPYQGQRISVIPNGVDIDRFSPATDEEKQMLRSREGLPPSGVYLVFIGGDWERKGVHYLLQSFNQLAKTYSDLHVLIVGAGDSKSFGELVDETYQTRVHFLGKLPNPETFYRLSDIFVFPSNYEACSLAVLEAAASGLAMVLTAVGGAEDIVEDGVSGYFITRDSDDITRKLEHLLKNPQKRRELSSEVRKRVEHQTWQQTYHEFEELYTALEKRPQSNQALFAHSE